MHIDGRDIENKAQLAHKLQKRLNFAVFVFQA